MAKIKRIKGREGKDGLASKVLKLNGIIRKDNQGRNYIAYCMFGYHQGFVLDEYVCQTRDCKHYRRFYEENN